MKSVNLCERLISAIAMMFMLFSPVYAYSNSDYDQNGTGDLISETSSPLIPDDNPVLLDTGDVIHSVPAPASRCQGLTWDGEYLWVSDYQTDLIYKVNHETGNIEHSITAPGDYVEGLAFDGTYILAAENGGSGGSPDVVYRLDRSSGNIISSVTLTLEWVHGITWDGANLWANDFATHRIYKLNPDNGQIESSFETTSGSIGLTWDGMYIWTDDFNDDNLKKHDPQTGAVIQIVDSPHTNPRDLAWDGFYLWVLSWQSATIYQVDVGGPPTVIDDDLHRAKDFTLLGNYPNPFNASTTIRYQISGQAHVRLDIYDHLGRFVYALEDANSCPGYHSLTWSGRNIAGDKVSSGVYFFKLRSEADVKIGKMMFLK